MLEYKNGEENCLFYVKKLDLNFLPLLFAINVLFMRMRSSLVVRASDWLTTVYTVQYMNSDTGLKHIS
jgi:hypothetical protein